MRADELGRRQRHGLVAGGAVAAVVGVAKAHGAVVEAAQALVADGESIKNMDISIIPGEKLLIRLWETVVEKGIGGLLSPWQTRRKGRAQIELQREERLVLAQTERDIEDIRAGHKCFTTNHQLIVGSAPSKEGTSGGSHALVAAQQDLILEQMRANVNVSKAVLSAEADLADDAQEPPDRMVDDDWLFRWRDSAGKVSSEELQALWGRVLAGEIKSPGTFSLRTLEFLKNLSQGEARPNREASPLRYRQRVLYPRITKSYWTQRELRLGF